MLRVMLCVVFLFSLTKVAFATESIISVKSDYTVKESADRFRGILEKKGFNIFTSIDHQKNATSVDLKLSPTEVVIFGNPKVGTPLMQCSKTVAIDLPQKALFWQDDSGQTWISYNNPKYLKERHNIKGCDQVIDKITGALAKLTKAAASKP